jgi:hypothetical protein
LLERWDCPSLESWLHLHTPRFLLLPGLGALLLLGLGGCPCIATGIQLSIRQHTKHTIKISQLKASHPNDDLVERIVWYVNMIICSSDYDKYTQNDTLRLFKIYAVRRSYSLQCLVGTFSKHLLHAPQDRRRNYVA